MPSQAFYDLPNVNNIEEAKTEAIKSAEVPKIGFTYGELIALDLPEREEIIFGLARGEVGIMNAIGNGGKTTILRNLTISRCTGKPFAPFGNFNLPKKVAFLDFEDTLTFLRKDLRVMLSTYPDPGKQLNENLLLLCDVQLDDEDLSLSNTFHLAQIIKRLKSFAPDLIIVDTISSAFQIRNENDNAEVRTFVMRILKRIAKECNAAVIAAHHIGKAKSEEGQTREASHKGRGASSFADMSRLILNLEKDNTDKLSVVISCAKVKGKSFADTILKLDTETRWFKSVGEKEPTHFEVILEFFEDGKDHLTKEVVDEFIGKISEPSIKRFLSDAVSRKKLERISHGKYRKYQSITPIRDDTLILSNKPSNNNDLQTQTKTSKNSLDTLPKCSDCQKDLDAMPSGEMFCPVCLKTFPAVEKLQELQSIKRSDY